MVTSYSYFKFYIPTFMLYYIIMLCFAVMFFYYFYCTGKPLYILLYTVYLNIIPRHVCHQFCLYSHTNASLGLPEICPQVINYNKRIFILCILLNTTGILWYFKLSTTYLYLFANRLSICV